MRTKYSLTFRITSIALGCFQNITSGGILYGWASISGSMLLATPTEGGPGLSADYIHIMFVTASFFSFLGPLLLGLILDSYGPRVCSFVSMLFIALGCALFAVSNIPNFPMFIPGLSMIAFGGPGVQNAIVHLCNLFPNSKATATAVVTGSFQLSFIVFFLFDQMWHFYKYDYQALFMTYGFICLCNAMLSLCIWPDAPYTYEDDTLTKSESSGGLIRLPYKMIRIDKITPVKRAGYVSNTKAPIRDLPPPWGKKISESYTNESPVNETSPSSFGYSLSHPPVKELSLKEQIMSNTFKNLTIFFVISSFWANFIIGTIDIQLGDSALMLSSYEQKMYGRYFTLCMTLGIIAIPFIGYMMDNGGFPLTSVATVAFGLIWSLLFLYDSKNLLIPSFIFYAMYRTFLFTFLFAYLADTMGFRYFGVLAGIMFAVGGFVGLLQYPLAFWAAGKC
jgi:hypothetical protein